MMDFSTFFIYLYDAVLTKEKTRFYVNDNRIRVAIKDMKEAYMPNPEWESNEAVKVANYNDSGHRCAYIHKYALLYTDMVCDLLQEAIITESIVHNFFESKRRLTMCSLGGGPGTDIVGAFAAFISTIGFIPCSVTILDCAQEWESTFKIIIQELRWGTIPMFSDMVTIPNFNYEYIGCNLLTDVASKYSVKEAISSADFLTMIKFISAAGCNCTRNMVENVFRAMKPGAMLLFIDNAAGGFQDMVEQVANQCEILLFLVLFCIMIMKNLSSLLLDLVIQVKAKQKWLFRCGKNLKIDFSTHPKILETNTIEVYVLSKQGEVLDYNQILYQRVLDLKDTK